MRRGHPSVGGWRNENRRHYRPRNPGAPHFRPSRTFGQPDNLRFRAPNPRHFRGRSFNPLPGHIDVQLELRDRNTYRFNNVQRPQERKSYNHDRHNAPTFNHHQTQRDKDHGAKYNDSKFYHKQDAYHVNSMGDTDLRHHHQMHNTDQFSSHKKSPWINNPLQYEHNKQYYDDHRSAHKTPKRLNMGDEMPLPDYSGHRPPASDHYTATNSSNNNNSQYTHSFDDTVDIIRKRLMNRDKSPSPVLPVHHQSNVDVDLRKDTMENYRMSLEQPVKKKVPKQKQNIKFNCDKMKNKIVHQLFKMDKAKIHKLMDNPSSSSKFEYAISTLITEGQNSLNRHMRSVAEKSLYGSSSDFIQNDSNTIYEDIFMKQMQGVLDPQDTVLLEDMKPMVMAELSRVLQIDDYQLEGMQDQGVTSKPATDNYSYFDEDYREQYGQGSFYDQNMQRASSYDNTNLISDDNLHNISYNERKQDSNLEFKPLFERRPPKPNPPEIDLSEEQQSTDKRLSDECIDKSFEYQQEKSNNNSPCDNLPLFNPNVEQLSDEDDPFAELDNQYHVEVDHNFIESTSCAPSPQQSMVDFTNDFLNDSENIKNDDRSCSIASTIKVKNEVALESISSVEIKNEMDTQLQTMANSPMELSPLKVINNAIESTSNIQTERENSIKKEMLDVENVIHNKQKSKKELVKEEKKFDSSTNTKSMPQRNSRKRSIDQKPSHRKEKRKKRSQSECQEIAKSIVNMFYSKDDQKDLSKDYKRGVPTGKTYSNKYVKRKQCKKENNDVITHKTDESKKLSTSSHSNVSPKDNNECSTKSEAKVKLKSIDMFVNQPKKSATHLAHRNTATLATVNSPEDIKSKIPIITLNKSSFCRKLTRRHIGTQMFFKSHNKQCQTDNQKKFYKETQTDPISTDTSKIISSNPLERMKEIDMEIQLLLQEKFKLYNSIEAKSKTDSIDTIPTLSMRIFDVNTQQTDEKRDALEDAIVDDFTSIPAEELEQIAIETFEDKIELLKTNKRGQRQKGTQLSLKSSNSPTSKRYKRLRAPNISLIEQIITDDRPIEDIISLDDLETTSVKSKKKSNKPLPKKKVSKVSKPSKIIHPSHPDIKPCSIVLERIDINKDCRHTKASVNNDSEFQLEVPFMENVHIPEPSNITEVLHEVPEIHESGEVVEEVVNDLQFDMLDVSEDIVIGDNCEVKTDKVDERIITEDIILDNSQSSIEEGTAGASGSGECKMYDYSTNENLRRDAITVTGNADAVLAIECIENDFIAACLDGNVYHFRSDGQLLNTLRGSNLAVTCLTIVRDKYETTVYTGSLDSRIRYYDLETGMEKGPECNVLSPIQTMDRAWDTVFVGTRTGFVLQFECKNNMLIPVSTVKFSEQSILALRALKEGPRKVLLVAARSENVTVKDAQSGLLLRTLWGPKMTVYTLLFEDGKVYCGTSSHNIHVFDYTSGGHVWSHEGGKGAVCLRACGSLVFAGCYDGCVYVFREGEPRPLAQLRGPSLMLLSLAIQGTNIIAGYKDRSLYIWKMPLTIVQEMVL